jgi:hypothetical protein
MKKKKKKKKKNHGASTTRREKKKKKRRRKTTSSFNVSRSPTFASISFIFLSFFPPPRLLPTRSEIPSSSSSPFGAHHTEC